MSDAESLYTDPDPQQKKKHEASLFPRARIMMIALLLILTAVVAGFGIVVYILYNDSWKQSKGWQLFIKSGSKMFGVDIISLVIPTLLSGVILFFINLIVHLGVTRNVSPWVEQEISEKGVFRPFQDLRFGIYIPCISPFVHSFVIGYMWQLFGRHVFAVATKSLFQIGGHFAMACWFAGTLPILLKDYCMYKVSGRITIYMLIVTLYQDIIAGMIMAHVL